MAPWLRPVATPRSRCPRRSGIVLEPQRLDDLVPDRSGNANLHRPLAGHLELDRTMAYQAKIDRDIDALTLEQVNTAFRKYVDPSKLVFIYAGDFAKTAK